MNVIEEIFPIKEVTVYPNAARIRRVQKVVLKKGENELVIKGLPEIITEESVRIEGGGECKVKILDILSRDTFIEQYDESKYRKELKKLEDLVLKQNKIEAGFRNYTDEFLLFLNKESLAGTDFEDIQRTIIVQNWEEFFQFVRKKLTENRDAVRNLLFQWINNQREIESARNNLKKLESYEKMKEHQVVTLLESPGDLEQELHVLYIQPGVSWYPAYTLRADIGSKRISVTLFGMITQITGEDWENVDLLLSTANPMHNCNIPEVKSKRIKERDTGIIMTQQSFIDGKMDELSDLTEDGDLNGFLDLEDKLDEKKLLRKDREERTRRSKAKVKISGKKGFTASLAPKLKTETKNVTTGIAQTTTTEMPLESGTLHIASEKEKKPGQTGRVGSINNLVQEVDNNFLAPLSLGILSSYYRDLYTYLEDRFEPEDTVPMKSDIRINKFFAKGVPLEQSIGGFDYRYKVASTQKEIPSSNIPVQVSVDIKDFPIELLYITIPLEKELVYLKAVFSNEYENPFPAGPAQIFVENNFLGNINFPTLGINQGTFISLGVEQDIKVIRKEKSFSKTGGLVKKDVTVRYTIEIEIVSYKSEPVVIEVLDRVPLSANKSDVTILDIEYDPAPLIVTDRKIVIWKETLDPKKKKVLKISYSIKHPEDFRLTMQRGNHPYLGKNSTK